MTAENPVTMVALRMGSEAQPARSNAELCCYPLGNERAGDRKGASSPFLPFQCKFHKSLVISCKKNSNTGYSKIIASVLSWTDYTK
jgi:hypothetical protein